MDGEESGRTGPAADRLWLVDPLCGTLNYAARTPLVAVNVALRDGDGIFVDGVDGPLAHSPMKAITRLTRDVYGGASGSRICTGTAA